MKLGCNYWASNAGTRMWKEWNPEAVRTDFEILSAHGIQWLRIFPVWSEFQPVIPMYQCGMQLREYRLEGERVSPNRWFLDEKMMEHFAQICDMAAEFDFSLIIGLLTGWMSGKCFVPPALYGKNLYTDCSALLLEQKYVEGLVSRFRPQKAIRLWELGNECNCLGRVSDHETAENWTAVISNAIRANDPDRPIASGMHGTDLEGNWRIPEIAAHTDVLTTHPYPFFVEYCDQDEVLSFRTLLHATCETQYYADLGHRPCLVEEIGTLGPCKCDNEAAARFLRVNLFSNWAHGADGLLWWCASEQTNLDFPPYEWNAIERELGMLDAGRQPKPVLDEMHRFSDWLKSQPYSLPQMNTDAVCILTRGQKQWGIAYMAYLLAKQAKVQLRFSYADQPLPEAAFYMLPSVEGDQGLSLAEMRKLEAKVRSGAVLYISMADGVLPDLCSLAGLEFRDSRLTGNRGIFTIKGENLWYEYCSKRTAAPTTAQVVARDEEGSPLLTENRYGNGKVFFLNFPIEKTLLNKEHAFSEKQFILYRFIFEERIKDNILDSGCPCLGITQHEGPDGIYAVVINYSGETVRPEFCINERFSVRKFIRGKPDEIAPYETAVIQFEHKKGV